MVSLYVQCNPFCDVVADVDMSVLAAHGLALSSAGFAPSAEVSESLFRALKAAGGELAVGGAGLGTARVANWLLRGSTGSESRFPVAYYGVVGDDEAGELVRSTLHSEGIAFVAPSPADAEVPTGRCAVPIVNGERTTVACPGAWQHVPDDPAGDRDAASGAVGARSAASVLYVPVFSLVANRAHGLAVAAAAREAGKVVVTNVSSSAFLRDPALRPEAEALFHSAHIVVGNAEEAAAIAELNGWPAVAEASTKGDSTATTSWLEATASHLAQKLLASASQKCDFKAVVFTDGSLGAAAAVARWEGDGESTAVRTVCVREPVPPLPPPGFVVDTNGAGDAFVGGMCSALVAAVASPEVAGTSAAAMASHFLGSAEHVRHILAVGHRAAGYVVQQRGCRIPAVPCTIVCTPPA